MMGIAMQEIDCHAPSHQCISPAERLLKRLYFAAAMGQCRIDVDDFQPAAISSPPDY